MELAAPTTRGEELLAKAGKVNWKDRYGKSWMRDSPMAVLKHNQREFAKYVRETIADGIPPSDAFDARETRWHIPSQFQALQRARRREFEAYRREQQSALFYSGETEYAEKYVKDQNGDMPSMHPMLDAALEEHKAMLAIDDREVRRQAVNGVLALTSRGKPVDEMAMGYTRGGAGVKGGKPLTKLRPESARRRATLLENDALGKRMLSVGAIGSPTDRTEATTTALLHSSLGDRDDDAEVRAAARPRRHGSITSPAGPDKGGGTWLHEGERTQFYNEARARALRATLERTREFSVDGGSPFRVTSSAADARRGPGISAEVIADVALRADGSTGALSVQSHQATTLSPEARAAGLRRTQKVLAKSTKKQGGVVVGGVGFAQTARRASKVVPKYAVRPRHGRGFEDDKESPRFDKRRGSLVPARRTSMVPGAAPATGMGLLME